MPRKHAHKTKVILDTPSNASATTPGWAPTSLRKIAGQSGASAGTSLYENCSLYKCGFAKASFDAILTVHPARQARPSRCSTSVCTAHLNAITGAATLERLDVQQADTENQQVGVPTVLPLALQIEHTAGLTTSCCPSSTELCLRLQETFSWTKQWYAVTLLDCIDKTRPNAIELLGKNFVLWYHDGTWTCFADQCPHRLAPLSGACACTGQLLFSCSAAAPGKVL